MTTKNKFYSINSIVNANCTPIVDGSNWITWSLVQLKGESVTELLIE